MTSAPKGRLHTLRRAVGSAVVDGFFRGVSRAGALHPRANPKAHGVERLRDIAYLDDGLPEHRLDVYKPAGPGPHPVLLYIHGGGFRILSKDTHWIMALAFARRGWVVFNASYRLAPDHPFPAGLADTCAAWEWVLANAARFGQREPGEPQARRRRGRARRRIVRGPAAPGDLLELGLEDSVEITGVLHRSPQPCRGAVQPWSITPRAATSSVTITGSTRAPAVNRNVAASAGTCGTEVAT